MIKLKKYGNYKLLKLLGSGGYGEVHLAIDQKDNKKYAIKILDKNKIVEENLSDSIKTEVHLMRTVHHPYIVKLYEVMTTKQKILLIMEYVEGGDLFDLIKEQDSRMLTEEQSRLYFQQIIMGLEYCHNINIIHRDLKPENILVDKKNNCIKISDFGLSTCIKSKNELLNDTAGTTRYLAPEVIKQTGHLGQAADIWSVGVILYNCVCGKFPFDGKDSNKLLNSILAGDVTYPKYLSKSLIDLLQKIFVTNPKTRYTIDQIKKHSWFITNLKPVMGYIKEVKQDIQYINSEGDQISKLVFYQKNSQINKGIEKDITSISFINCFELMSIIIGNNISNIFCINKESNNIKECYKFYSIIDYNKTIDQINNFFKYNFNETNFIKLNNQKYIIDIMSQDNQLLSIIFYSFRLNNSGKFIYFISFKKGENKDYHSFIKNFFEKNRNIFNLL